MSIIIIDNELLKNEINALNDYVNRDEYNLNVVEVMANEIRDIIKGLKPCEKVSGQCPYCGSENVDCLYEGESMNGNKSQIYRHYICRVCQKEFNV